MSRACDVVILPAATTAFPNSGAKPGDVYVGTGGAIAGAVAVVNNAGAAIAIEATLYTPVNDNLTDLGTTAARFRTIYLGTGATIGDSAASNAGNISSPGNGQLLLTSQTGVAGFKFVGAGGVNDVNGAQLTAAATAVAPVLEAYGADTNIGFTVRQKGAGGLTLGNTTGGVGFYGVTPVAKPTGAVALGAFTDPPSAAEMSNLRTQFNRIVTALSTTAGLGLCTG